MIVLKLHVSTCNGEAAVPAAPVLVIIVSAFELTGHVLFYQESTALQKLIVIIRDTQPTVAYNILNAVHRSTGHYFSPRVRGLINKSLFNNLCATVWRCGHQLTTTKYMWGTGNQQLQLTTHAHALKSSRFKALADLILREASVLWNFLGLQLVISSCPRCAR